MPRDYLWEFILRQVASALERSVAKRAVMSSEVPTRLVSESSLRSVTGGLVIPSCYSQMTSGNVISVVWVTCLTFLFLSCPLLIPFTQDVTQWLALGDTRLCLPEPASWAQLYLQLFTVDAVLFFPLCS